jgi:hypothetical protein
MRDINDSMIPYKKRRKARNYLSDMCASNSVVEPNRSGYGEIGQDLKDAYSQKVVSKFKPKDSLVFALDD